MPVPSRVWMGVDTVCWWWEVMGTAMFGMKTSETERLLEDSALNVACMVGRCEVGA